MTGNRILYFYALLISFALFVLLDAYLFHLLFLFLLILPVVSLLAALPVIMGFQLFLSAIHYDVMNIPKKPLHKFFLLHHKLSEDKEC